MINVRSNIKEFTKGLDFVAKRQMPYATSKAINKVAEKAEGEIKKQIKTLHNPVPFTLKSTFVKYSNKNDKPITAIVGVKDKTAEYLQHLEEATPEQATGKAIPVPVDRIKNKAGNIPRGGIKKRLADKTKYFSGTPRGGRTPGVYQRMGTAKKPKLKMVASWHKSIRHSQKLRIGPRVRLRVEREFNKELYKQFKAAIR